MKPYGASLLWASLSSKRFSGIDALTISPEKISGYKNVDFLKYCAFGLPIEFPVESKLSGWDHENRYGTCTPFLCADNNHIYISGYRILSLLLYAATTDSFKVPLMYVASRTPSPDNIKFLEVNFSSTGYNVGDKLLNMFEDAITVAPSYMNQYDQPKDWTSEMESHDRNLNEDVGPDHTIILDAEKATKLDLCVLYGLSWYYHVKLINTELSILDTIAAYGLSRDVVVTETNETTGKIKRYLAFIHDDVALPAGVRVKTSIPGKVSDDESNYTCTGIAFTKSAGVVDFSILQSLKDTADDFKAPLIIITSLALLVVLGTQSGLFQTIAGLLRAKVKSPWLDNVLEWIQLRGSISHKKKKFRIASTNEPDYIVDENFIYKYFVENSSLMLSYLSSTGHRFSEIVELQDYDIYEDSVVIDVSGAVPFSKAILRRVFDGQDMMVFECVYTGQEFALNSVNDLIMKGRTIGLLSNTTDRG